MKSAVNSLSNLGTKLFLYPITFFASIWIARYLGPEEKGMYAYILILTSFLIPIFSLGIGGGIIYYISSKEFHPKDVGFTVFIVGLIIGISNSILLYGLWSFGILGEMSERISSLQVVFLGCILIFNSIYFFVTRMMMGASQFHTINFFELSKSLMNPVIMVTLVYLLALRIHGVIYGLILLNAVLAIGMSWRFYKLYQPRIKVHTDFIRKSFRYGLKGWLGDMAVRANVRLDQLILGGVVSVKSLGFYSVGVALAEMLWIVPDSIGPVLFNRIASEKNIDIKTALTEQMHRLLFSLSLVIAALWVTFCLFIVIPYGYGTEYNSSILPLLIMVPGALVYIPAKVTTKLLSGSGRILDTSKATAIGSCISILLYFILIPTYGIVGAAVASSIGYLCVSICCVYYTKKHFKLSLKRLVILTKEDFIWMRLQYTSLVNLAHKKMK